MKSITLSVSSLLLVLPACVSERASSADEARRPLEPGSRVVITPPSGEPEPAAAVAAAIAAAPAEPAAPSPAPDAPPVPEPPPSALAAPAAVPGSSAGRATTQRGAHAPGAAGDTSLLLPRPPALSEVETRARSAFAQLSAKDQGEVLIWFAVELEKLGTFQSSLIDHVLSSEERARDSWPAYAEAEWFDPPTHAPAQPIPRERLASDSPKTRSVRKQLLGAIAPRRAQSGWRYDYATRELQRYPDCDEPTRIFENALIGLPPDWDLVEALVERALDDGSMQKSFVAFGHAYTDRDGGAYPGVSLYDAWASNTQFETPDVDCLGIIHDLLGDWQTWKSVVPDTQQAALYKRLGELFQVAHRYRGLRHNLARSYLCGSTELRDSYQGNLDRFHALWESASSDPARLAPALPSADRSFEFLQGWVDQLQADELALMKGYRRRCTLDDDGRRVRDALLWVLDQFGAYEGLEATSAKPAVKALEQG